MALHAVFFDLDGTLLDTAPDLGRALNQLLQEENRPSLAQTEIRRVVSDGAYALLEIGFGVTRDDPDCERLRDRLLSLYSQDIANETAAFEGIGRLIEQLDESGIHWGIVTNKPVSLAAPLMTHFEFASTPTCLVCPEHVAERKPHPEALIQAMETAECNPDTAVYIGDHLRDIECGRNAGVPTIAAAYGYIREDDSAEAWGADHIAEHASELWPILQQYR